MSEEAEKNTTAPEGQNPLDAQATNQKEGSEYQIVQGVLKNEEQADDLLDMAPEIDSSLLEGVAPSKSKLLVVLKVLFVVLVAFGIGSFVFFSSQLEDSFDFITNRISGFQKIARQLDATSEEIIDLQTDLNFYRTMTLKAYLDQFSVDGDVFTHDLSILSSKTLSKTKKEAVQKEMDEYRAKLREPFLKAREVISHPLTAPVFMPDNQNLESFFQQKLTTKLTNEASGVGLSEADVSNSVQFKTFEQAINLVGNSELKTLLMETDFDELTDRELFDKITKLNKLVVNNLSTIQKVKDHRLKWTDILKEIDLITIQVDSQYNSTLYDFEDAGGIRYDSFSFNGQARTVTISGQMKLFDGRNFTMMTNLVDKINESELFDDVEVRSFSKSGDVGSSYTSSIKFVLKIPDPEAEAEAAAAEAAAQEGANGQQ